MADRIESFEEFWPYYVRAHQNEVSRTLHFIGTAAGLSSAAIGLLTGRGALVAAAAVLGYGPAWIGHFVFERNVPATFGHPLWSLRADFMMFSKMLRGEMKSEVERVVREHDAAAGAHPAYDGDEAMPPINVSYEPSGPVN